jgi:hypothetical protein
MSNPSEELVRRQGLLKVLGSRELDPDRVATKSGGADHQRGNETQRRVVELVAAEVPPVHAGHEHVQHDYVRAETQPQFIESDAPVGGGDDLISMGLDQFREPGRDVAIVIDYQDRG